LCGVSYLTPFIAIAPNLGAVIVDNPSKKLQWGSNGRNDDNSFVHDFIMLVCVANLIF
jgi:hypothetical protein